MSTVQFNISGMSCAACAATVEKAAKGCEGVQNAEVQLLANRLTLDIAPECDVSAVMGAVCTAVAKAGYKASTAEQQREDEKS